MDYKKLQIGHGLKEWFIKREFESRGPSRPQKIGLACLPVTFFGLPVLVCVFFYM
jgi:hypothetical protein